MQKLLPKLIVVAGLLLAAVVYIASNVFQYVHEPIVVEDESDVLEVGAAGATLLEEVASPPPVGFFRRAKSWLQVTEEARQQKELLPASADGFVEDVLPA